MEAINVIIRNVTPLTYDVLKRMMEENGKDVKVNLHQFVMNDPKALSLNEADLLIIHLGNNTLNEWKYLKRLKVQMPELPVLLWGEQPSLELLRTALEYGVQGLITDEDSSDTLMQVLQALANGEKYFDQELMIELTQSDDVLSKREVTLLSYVAQEFSRYAIAQQLKLSVRTVDLMLKTLREKLGVSTNIGLALYAKKVGLV